MILGSSWFVVTGGASPSSRAPCLGCAAKPTLLRATSDFSKAEAIRHTITHDASALRLLRYRNRHRYGRCTRAWRLPFSSHHSVATRFPRSGALLGILVPWVAVFAATGPLEVLRIGGRYLCNGSRFVLCVFLCPTPPLETPPCE